MQYDKRELFDRPQKKSSQTEKETSRKTKKDENSPCANFYSKLVQNLILLSHFCVHTKA